MGSADYDHLVKYLLLGESSVGKSSLVQRYCEGKFDANLVYTIGVDFKWKNVERNGLKLKLQFWDTAGQEKFRTLMPQYYRKADAIVVVYDITNHNSFQCVEGWMEELAQHVDANVERILIGNKSDLEDSRQVKKEEGEGLARRLGMDFFETSAKTGANLEAAFLHVGDRVVKARNAAGAPVGTSFQLNQQAASRQGEQAKNCAC